MFRDNLNNEKHFFRLSYLIVIISFILDFYYRFFISKQYDQLGFELAINPFKYLIAKSGLLLILFISYFIFSRSLFLYSIYLLLVLFFYIPNSVIFSLADASYKPFLANFIFVALFYFSTHVKLKMPKIDVNPKITDWTLIALTVIMVAPIIFAYRSNVVFSTLLLQDVYSTREVFSEKMSGLLSYFYHLSVKTVLPITLIYFLIRKKNLLVLFYFIVLLYLYVISGNKIVYFNSFLILIFYFFHFDYVKKVNYFLVTLILALLIFPMIDYIFLDMPILTGTFVNRFLFIPALLTQWYFDFFDGRPFYFAESHLFNMFVKSPYDLPVGFLISKVYLHTIETYANNGVVSDGFMNLGFIGVPLFSLIVSGLFGVINSLRMNPGYFGLYFGYIYMLLSAPLLSCFITGGIFLFLLMAMFVLNNKKSQLI